MKAFRVFLLALVAVTPFAAQHTDDLTFLANLDEFEHVRDALPSYLRQHAVDFLDKRDRQVAQPSTLSDLARRKAYLRDVMTRDVGGFPGHKSLSRSRCLPAIR